MEILLQVKILFLTAVLFAAAVEKYSYNHKHTRFAEKALDTLIPTAVTVSAVSLVASIFQSFIN